jgi:hypothetical protein
VNNKPTHLVFEKMYPDGFNAELAVEFYNMSVSEDCRVIQFKNYDDSVQIPLEQLDWLIDCLQQIKEATK